MNNKNFSVGFLLLISIFSQAQKTGAYNYHSQKNVTCSKGAVVSAHPLASMVGVNILKQGGNAFDAAIATQLALAVVYPAAGNLGGGGFLVAGLANGENITIDYRETAPGKAYKDMYLDKNGDPVKILHGNRPGGETGDEADSKTRPQPDASALDQTDQQRRLDFAHGSGPDLHQGHQGGRRGE